MASSPSRPPLQGWTETNQAKADEAARCCLCELYRQIEFPPQQIAPLQPGRSFGGGV